jgi:replication-associated recombination protein RarA
LRIIASEDVGLADPAMASRIWLMYQNWQDLKRGSTPGYEGFYRVVMLQAVVMLARAPKSRMLDHALMVFFAGERERREIPDYALDMHTRRGRKMGRNVEHFLAEGSKLVNETIDDPYREEGQAALLASERKPKPLPPPDPSGGQLELGEFAPTAGSDCR